MRHSNCTEVNHEEQITFQVIVFRVGTLVTSATILVWLYVLVRASIKTELNFIKMLAALLLISQVSGLVYSLLDGYQYVQHYCYGALIKDKWFWILQFFLVLIFYLAFDLALWLYAAKYWTTSHAMLIQVQPLHSN